LHVAAEASLPMADLGSDRNAVRAWVVKLSTNEKDDLVAELMVNADHARIAELQQRFLKERPATAPGSVAPGRTVGQLLRAAKEHATERKRIRAEKEAKEKARRERDAALARDKYLDSIAGQERRLWAEIDSLTATKQPKSYDQAVKLLVDLRDLDVRNKGGDFLRRFEVLRQEQARKPSFIERLRKAGL